MKVVSDAGIREGDWQTAHYEELAGGLIHDLCKQYCSLKMADI